MRLGPGLAICLLAQPVLADPPLTAEAFDALTQGRTMTWSEFGQVYGVEQYLPDRRVRWTVLGDDCKTGHWYPEGDAICFAYEDDPTPACWIMTEAPTGLYAAFPDDQPGRAPVLVEEATAPLPCFGPEVGV